MSSVASALAEARGALRAAGVESPGLDARLLLAEAAGADMARLIATGHENLPEVAERRFHSHIGRRMSGEPVARILGEKEFWGIPFEVGPGTLVPRPDTETLVEAVLAETARFPAYPRICDLGAGTGAILIALLRELPRASGMAIDISAPALAVARRNAERLGVAARMRFACADFARPPRVPFDVVVSNPPYVRSADITGLPPEVRDHDPRLALDGGPDGLDAYRAIIGQADALLVAGGLLALEVGKGQAEEVADMCRMNLMEGVAFRSDLSGTPRVVLAAKPVAGPGRKPPKKALGKVGMSE